MTTCQHCGEPLPAGARVGQRYCNRKCYGLSLRSGKPRVHRWGKTRDVGSAHRALRAQLLPAALGTLCPQCRRVRLTRDNAQLGHRVPRALGGPTTPANCRMICAPCNRHDGAVLGGKRAHAKQRARRRTPARVATARPSEWTSRKW